MMWMNQYISLPARLSRLSLRYATPLSGIAGCLVITMGLMASISNYTRHTVYSPKNHFISELGLASASEYSYVFNSCLGLGGLLLMFFTYGLGNYLHKSPLATPAMYIGMVATLSFSAVGYYTADSWTGHRNAATVFFTGVMVSIVLFSYCIYTNKQRSMHHFIAFQGFVIATIYAVVLVWPKDLLFQSVNNPQTFVRPELWGLTILEWSYCLMIGLWVFTVSADMLYALKREEAAHRA